MSARQEKNTPGFSISSCSIGTLTISFLERYFDMRGDAPHAWVTLIVNVCRGLLLDHLGAGETERVKAAVAVFQNMGGTCCRRIEDPI